MRRTVWMILALGLLGSLAAHAEEEGKKPDVPEGTEVVEHDASIFRSDPAYADKPYDPQAQEAIYGGKHLNRTARPPVEWGHDLYDFGAYAPSRTWFGELNPAAPQLIVYGDWRIAAAYNDDGVVIGGGGGETHQSTVATRLNLDIDLRLTANERLHVFVRPFDRNGSFLRYDVDGKAKGFEERFDFNLETFFFEGDWGPLAMGMTGRENRLDLPFTAGFVPLFTQNGIWLNDAFYGGAFAIPAFNSRKLDVSNADLTFFAAFDKVTTPAVPEDEAAVYGLAGFAEANEGYWEGGYAYVDSDVGDLGYHNATLAFSRRYGAVLSNSVRVIANFGQNPAAGFEKTADGALLLIEKLPDRPPPLHADPLLQPLRRLRPAAGPGPRRRHRRRPGEHRHQLRERRPDRLPHPRRHGPRFLGRRLRGRIPLQPRPPARRRGGGGTADGGPGIRHRRPVRPRGALPGAAQQRLDPAPRRHVRRARRRPRRPRRRAARGGHFRRTHRNPPQVLMRHLAVLPLLAFAAAAATPAAAAPARLDPERTVGPEACAKCHDRELEVWKGTAHAELYRSPKPLHQRPRAQQIAKNMSQPLIKNDSLCLSCHFTPRPLSGKVTAQAGVSCEHCHGAARDWISEHNTFAGRQVNRQSETPEQRRQRWERNARLGMRSGGQLYDLLASCYRCHLVPDEKLVNVGGHVPGGDFDLPARFDQIRHNFVRGLRKANAETTPERRRQLYVLGLALELEHSLRGLAEAREDGGGYATALAERIDDVKKRLRKAALKVPLPQLAPALAAADGLRLAAGNAGELSAAIRKVSAAARSFAEQEDGSRLAALDPLLQEADEPPPDETEETAAVEAAEPAEGENEASAPSNPSDPSSSKGGPSSAKTPAAAARTAAPQGPTGKVKDRLRTPRPAGKVLGPRSCQASCHAEPNQKWRKDKHFRTADPFQNGDERFLRIATLYYGQPANDRLATGGIVCMDCHGTVKAGEIEAGVSCESCHGPAGAFKDAHDDASGRAARLALGILDLENPAKRAEVCSSCHYITDSRLISSGHPVPKTFDLWERSEKIRHWKGGGPDAGSLRAALQQVIGRRGAVPQVAVARLAEAPGGVSPSGGPAPSRSSSAGPPPSGGGSLERRIRAANGQPPAPRPFASSAAAASPSSPSSTPAKPVRIDLPPLPEGLDERPVAEILEQVQRRLELLYRRAGGGS